MSSPRPGAARIGGSEWTRRTGGRLTRREQVTLLPPVLRSYLDTAVGRACMALGHYSGSKTDIEYGTLAPPDTAATREVRVLARGLLSPCLYSHCERTFAWGSALATIERLDFDAEALYVASMLHDIGLVNPTRGVDFTVASARYLDCSPALLDLSAVRRETITDAICLHSQPGITVGDGDVAHLLSAGAALDVFGLRAWELSNHTRSRVVAENPRLGFKREFTQLFRAEARAVPRGRAWFLRRYGLADLTIRLAPFKG